MPRARGLAIRAVPHPFRRGRRRPTIHVLFFLSSAAKTRGWSAFADHDGGGTLRFEPVTPRRFPERLSVSRSSGNRYKPLSKDAPPTSKGAGSSGAQSPDHAKSTTKLVPCQALFSHEERFSDRPTVISMEAAPPPRHFDRSGAEKSRAHRRKISPLRRPAVGSGRNDEGTPTKTPPPSPRTERRSGAQDNPHRPPRLPRDGAPAILDPGTRPGRQRGERDARTSKHLFTTARAAATKPCTAVRHPSVPSPLWKPGKRRNAGILP